MLLPQGARDDASLAKATAYAEERLKEVIRQEKLNPTRMGIARTPDDLFLLKQAGKKAIFLGIENGCHLLGNRKRVCTGKRPGQHTEVPRHGGQLHYLMPQWRQ